MVDDQIQPHQRDGLEAYDPWGYYSPLFANAALPYRNPDPEDNLRTWERHRGPYQLILSPAAITDIDGRIHYRYPYGVHARLMLLYLISTAREQNSRHLKLGDSFAEFISKIGVKDKGGKSYSRIKDQLVRLVTCKMDIRYLTNRDGIPTYEGGTLILAEKYDIPRTQVIKGQLAFPQLGLTLTLSQMAYERLVEKSFPVDIKAIAELSTASSPMQIDLFLWMAYRLPFLEEPLSLSWQNLYDQFGQDYKRLRDFKRDFLKNLQRVRTLYKDAKVKEIETGIIFQESKSFVPLKQ